MISWLAGDAWIAAAGEYAFRNAGARLEDLPTQTLVEVAYYLIRRDILDGVVDERVANARRKALRSLDDSLLSSEVDDDTGLPSWIVQAGIGPADGSSPFG